MRCRLLFVLCALLLIGPKLARGQQPAPPSRIGVFLDCQTFCDGSYIRTEITFVDWVRDRADADVHLLVTSQSTGGGGSEFTLTFIGLRAFAGSTDTLKLTTGNTDTEDEMRGAQVRKMKLGLVRFAARSTVGEKITVSYEAPAAGDTAAATKDAWNNWVFQIQVNGNASGERTNSYLNVNGRLRADRVTEDWKINLQASGNRQRSAYDLEDSTGATTTVESIRRNYGGFGQIVRSLGNQWSAGLKVSVNSNSRVNQTLKVQAGPALEYDFFPYSQSTRQQVTLQYSLAPVHYAYEDTTVFNKMDELRVQQQLQLAAGITQPWGSINATVEGSVFVDNWSQHSVDVNGDFNFRVFRGLSFYLYGGFSRLKDQIYLAKAEVDNTSVLLGTFQLGTDYQYYTGFGLTFQFGSKLNNIVNPRFDK